MTDLNLAFQFENGLVFSETDIAIFSGADDPSTGVSAPVGSFFLRSSGDAYLKTGTLNINWSRVLKNGDVTINLVQPTSGLTITGGPINNSGTITFALANDLAALEGLSGTGFAVRTGTDTWANRTLTAGTGISISNGTGADGDPVITNTGVTSAFGRTGVVLAQEGDYSLNLLSDVSLTSPSAFQVLAYNGSQWVNTGAVGANATGLVGAGQSSPANWTLISGTRYRADFVHNLGTSNVVVNVWNTSNNDVVIPARITALDANTVRIEVNGNTATLRVVVVANGQSIVAGGSTPSSVIAAKDGVDILSGATRLNFVGQAVNVANSGGGTANITIGSRFTFFSASLDSPNSSDWAVNANAALTTDPSYASLNVRSFSDTVEQGVGALVSVPPGTTQFKLKIRGRPQTAPGTASVVQFRVYTRQLPPNSTVGTWSSATDLSSFSVPTNANFQYFEVIGPLSTIGMVADRMFQIEVTRKVSGVSGTNLAANFLLAEMTLEFF
jgi:hypothetical protein